jgi:acetyl-CoA decarbonylase/synthase complex subunit gamma
LVYLAVGSASRRGAEFLEGHAAWTVVVGTLLLCHAAVRSTYAPSSTESEPQPPELEPRPLQLRWWHHPMALMSWIDSFRRTYALAPGLYYAGPHYDRESPLLVTANYGLSVYLLLRALAGRTARVLIVDTDGINVWCAAGKGRFSHREILRQLDRYPPELLSAHKRPKLILPKLAMAGVRLKALRDRGLRPIVGPVHARDLPAWLDAPPLRNCREDRVVFGLRARAFTWLPGLVQSTHYSLAVIACMFGLSLLFSFSVPLGVVAIVALTTTAYPLLFPWLPGRRFAVKGLWLGAAVAVASSGLHALAAPSPIALAATGLFCLAFALFFGLSYTGNSAVSNYTRVRQETARFLPLTVGLFVISLSLWITSQVLR